MKKKWFALIALLFFTACSSAPIYERAGTGTWHSDTPDKTKSASAAYDDMQDNNQFLEEVGDRAFAYLDTDVFVDGWDASDPTNLYHVLPPLIGTSDPPASATHTDLTYRAGMTYYNYTDDELCYYTGSAWSCFLLQEAIDARGSKDSLDARLNVALNDDGTPKATASVQNWVTGDNATYFDDAIFEVTGSDVTDTYTDGRRVRLIRAAGASVYCTVLDSLLTGSDTYVGVACDDSATVPANLESVDYGIVDVSSVPAHEHTALMYREVNIDSIASSPGSPIFGAWHGTGIQETYMVVFPTGYASRGSIHFTVDDDADNDDSLYLRFYATLDDAQSGTIDFYERHLCVADGESVLGTYSAEALTRITSGTIGADEQHLVSIEISGSDWEPGDSCRVWLLRDGGDDTCDENVMVNPIWIRYSLDGAGAISR